MQPKIEHEEKPYFDEMDHHCIDVIDIDNFVLPSLKKNGLLKQNAVAPSWNFDSCDFEIFDGLCNEEDKMVEKSSDELEETFTSPVTDPYLSRSIRVKDEDFGI